MFFARTFFVLGIILSLYTVTVEFDKNANSLRLLCVLAITVGLATIGVCVFCAFTSVGALFILRRFHYETR